ncbi:hypothetical protein Q3G72_013623 [Acer saccharum]|nr:hypothetical protein Q3G72_013623 [Acer saccharum]
MRGGYDHVSSGNRSFADVVEGRKQGMEVNRGSEGGNICYMNWKGKREGFDWLDRCAVGVLKNFSRRLAGRLESWKIASLLSFGSPKTPFRLINQGTLRGEYSIRNRNRQGDLGRISHSAIGLKPGQLSVVLGPLQNVSRSLVLDQEPDPLVTSYNI